MCECCLPLGMQTFPSSALAITPLPSPIKLVLINKPQRQGVLAGLDQRQQAWLEIVFSTRWASRQYLEYQCKVQARPSHSVVRAGQLWFLLPTGAPFLPSHRRGWYMHGSDWLIGSVRSVLGFVLAILTDSCTVFSPNILRILADNNQLLTCLLVGFNQEFELISLTV